MKRPRRADAPRGARPPSRAAGGRGERRPSRPRHRAKTEEMFHGVRACEAIFARRPEDIVRVYVAESQRRRFAALTAWCAKERRGFQIVPPENLARIAGSLHHEGIAILARAVRRHDMADLLRGLADGTIHGPLVYLDGVQNPHNLGTILRTAAHFGAGAVIGRTGELPGLSAAAARVAEGAAEVVPVVEVADAAADLRRLATAGYAVVATSSHRGESLHKRGLAPRSVILLGSEGEGLSRGIEAVADRHVRIPGTGAVESLNVSVACGVLLAAATRPAGSVPGRAEAGR